MKHLHEKRQDNAPLRAGAWAFSTALLMISGCSGSAGVEAEYDSHAAQETLTTALDAWQERALSRLKAHQPPIRFTDDDLVDGCQLLEYRLTNPSEPIEPYENVSVDLVLTDPRGQHVERTFGYQVTLGERPAVLRTQP